MTPQQEPQSAPIDLQDILWRVRRYRLLPFVPLVLVLCAALIYLRIAKPIYQSYVIVDMGSRATVSSALEPLVRSEREGGDFRANIERLNNRIHSRSFLSHLVDRLGIGRSPELLLEASAAVKRWKGITAEEYAMRIATNSISRKIVVMPAAQGQMRILAMDSDPREAQRLASTIAVAIIEEGKQNTLKRFRARGEFSADQVAVYEERLRKSETALREFQESAMKRRFTGSIVNDQNLIDARNLIQLTDSEMDQIRVRIRADLAEWQSRSGAGRDVPELRSARAAELESRLMTLEINHGVTSLQAAASKDDVAALTLKIGSARQELLNEYVSLARRLLTDQSDVVREAAAGIALDRSELRSLREKRKRLSDLVSEYTRNVESSPRNQMELDRLQSEVSTNRDLLLALRREATSSRISEALQTSHLGLQLEVIEEPQFPLAPVKPNKVKVVIIALLLGPVLSVGLILGAERVAAVVRSVEEAERELGIKVIGTVPRIEGWARPGSYFQKHGALLSIVLVVLFTVMFYTLPVDTFSGRSTGGGPAAPAR